MNKSLSKTIGTRIKMYRKSQKTSQVELAKAINKSKSTLCRYEDGSIVLDIETISDISRALKVPMSCLLGNVDNHQNYPDSISAMPNSYMYFLDDHGTMVRESFLEIVSTGSLPAATLYCDADENCKSKASLIYTGEVLVTDTVISFDLVSVTNELDHLFFTSLRPFIDQGPYTIGLCIALNFSPICPVCYKAVLAEKRVDEKQKLLKQIQVDDTELKSLKKYSRFCLFYV